MWWKRLENHFRGRVFVNCGLKFLRMFNNLAEKLNSAFKVLKGQGKITQVNIGQTLKEVRRALIQADVGYKIANDFIKSVKQKAIGQKVESSLQPKQLFIKIVHDELTELMGSKTKTLPLQSRPLIILLAGLQGTGKTTIAGKLALELKQKHKKTPLLVACDVYRPAAIEQLKILSERAQVDFYAEQESKNPIKIARNALSHAKSNGNDTIIVDTAGRLAIDQQMMDEIKQIKNQIRPTQTLFVLDSMMGQDAVNTAKAFNQVLELDGVVLSKLDSDARGGSALSVMSVVEKPILYVGVGEKLEDIEVFHPKRMANRILGMGDIVSLVEKSREAIDQKEAQRILKKASKNKFNLDDLMVQLNMLQKMGGLKRLSNLLPVQNQNPEDTEEFAQRIAVIRHIYQSMTPKERSNPKIINHSRKIRIANGSGNTLSSVNQVLGTYEHIGKMMKMSLSDRSKMMSHLNI